MPQDDILSMRAISKEFPGVRALSGVDFSLQRGEVHALVGENGAGKSTLIKILAGVHPAGSYGGEISVNGAPARFSSIRDSERAGIAVIFQELALARNLSIAENLFLGHEPARHGIIDCERLYGESRRLLAEVGLDLSPELTLEHLGVGVQQSLEIAKALGRSAAVLVLDEPTAALTDEESERLLALLAGLREKGVSSIYISHKLKEVFRIADRITVLRDGGTVGTYPAAALDEEKLVALMVGRALVERYPARPETADAPQAVPVLAVEDWTVADPLTGDLACEGVSFMVHPGEILGIAGLMGAGRTELAMSLFGAWGEVRRGSLAIGGGTPGRFADPAAAIAAGLAYLSEDRKRYGLVLPMEIRENCTLAGLSRLARLGVFDANAEIRVAEEAVADLGIKTPSIEQQVVNLSGGNQQKVVLAKWLFTQPRVLILDEPTRGIDVGAKYEIYLLMRKLVAAGMAVVMISSELPEVLGMSDRILVLHEGRVAAVLPRAAADQETIMQYATGARGRAAS